MPLMPLMPTANALKNALAVLTASFSPSGGLIEKTWKHRLGTAVHASYQLYDYETGTIGLQIITE